MTAAPPIVARRSRAVAIVAALSASICAPAAVAVDLVNPAPLVEAFRTTCLAGFPDVDAIARRAIAAGWVERKVTLIGKPGKGMSATNLPRFFEWRGLNMSLMRAGQGILVTSCQVSSPSAASLDTATLAASAGAALGLGEPTRTTRRGSDLAQWRRSPGQMVQASADKQGGMRSANLLIRLEPEQTRP